MSGSQKEIAEFLSFLHGSLDAGETLFLAPSDNVEGGFGVTSLEDATRLAGEWANRGVFATTGTFANGAPRKREHLLSIPVITLDADLPSVLIAEGMEPAVAAEKIYTLSPELLAHFYAKHRKLIVDVLADFDLSPSLLVNTGNGFHAHFPLDFLDQRAIDHIVKVRKLLVAKLKVHPGWELFDQSVVDAGTRYVRVPGTANLKTTPPRWATIIQNGGPTWTLEQLEKAAGVPEEETTADGKASDDEQEKAEGEDQHAEVKAKVVALLVPYWQKSKRHILSLALAGFLGKSAGWSWKQTKQC